MLQPVSISIQQFKCFGDYTYQYPTTNGLHFVTGRNNAHTELEANACGKSTLFCDAPCWCLYGKTPRGVAASDIVHWEKKTAKVEFTFYIRGQLVTIVRQQNPNQLLWKLEGKSFEVVTQTELDSLLGLDYSAFCNAVVFSQLAETFFDLRPAEKSSMLESVLPLDVWERATAKAKQQADQLNSELESNLLTIAELKGKLQALNELDFADKIAEWEAVRQEEIGEIEESLADDNQKLEELREFGRKYQQKVQDSHTQLREIEQLLAEATAEYEQIRQKSVEVERQQSAKVTEVTLIDRELNRLQKLGPVCSQCKQTIPHTHLVNEESKLNSKRNGLMDQLERLDQAINQVKMDLKSVGADVGDISNTRISVLNEVNAFANQVEKVKMQAASILDEQKRKNSRILSLKERINPFLEQEKKIIKEKRRLVGNIAEQKQCIDQLKQTLHGVAYWVQGYKAVKLMVISDILLQLELEVTNYLYQFGLKDWKVEFSVESLTKSGKQRKGFDVTIKPPHLDQAVPWKSWSGGETQRLRLAGALGMADLILSCFGATPGLEVWDEPSLYLSQQGIADLLDVLRDRALTSHRKIFLIDHRNLDITGFASVQTVVREQDAVEVVNE